MKWLKEKFATEIKTKKIQTLGLAEDIVQLSEDSEGYENMT